MTRTDPMSLRVHTGLSADPPWIKPAFIVMAGLVPAIASGRLPRPMAGTSPAMTVDDAKCEPGLVLGAQRRGNPHRSAHLDGDCFVASLLAMTDCHA
jgi:hypothetical protein